MFCIITEVCVCAEALPVCECHHKTAECHEESHTEIAETFGKNILKAEMMIEYQNCGYTPK